MASRQSKPWFKAERFSLFLGDCRDVLSSIKKNSVDSVVTDPPYELGFMGKSWDSKGIAYSVEMWQQVLRVLKPGGHVLAFGGSRTHHRMMVAIEDAGFEIRDVLMWLYGSGFPKGLRTDLEIWKWVRRWQSNENAQLVVQLSSPFQVQLSGETVPIVLALAQILPEDVPVLLMETGEEVGPRGLTVTSQLESKVLIDLNMMSLWKRRSDVGYDEVKKSTIKTILEMTIGSRTSSFLQRAIMQKYTIKDVMLQPGVTWPALHAVKTSRDGSKRQSVIPILSVLGDAMWNPLVKYQGVNVALKPAYEPVILARKPFSGSLALNVQRWGTGGLNIDGARILTNEDQRRPSGGGENRLGGSKTFRIHARKVEDQPKKGGRWPANVLFDEETAKELDRQSGESTSPPVGSKSKSKSFAWGNPSGTHDNGHGDSGGASRFFYTSKSSRSEREFALGDLKAGDARETVNRDPDSAGVRSPRAGAGRGASPIFRCEKCGSTLYGGTFVSDCLKGGKHIPIKIGVSLGRRNIHPTVKPVDLMRWLCRLITSPNGVVLDPFLGSGSTGRAALAEGFRFVGIDLDEHYLEIAKRRIAAPIVSQEKMSKSVAADVKRDSQRDRGYKGLLE